MSRWFRFYDRALDDPKVQRLAPDVFKGWVNLLCLASRNNGILPSLGDIAFALRISDREADSLVSTLLSAGLLDDAGEGTKPHNWNDLQYVERFDPTNAERQRRHREKRNVTHNVTVTPLSVTPRTDTETEHNREKSAQARALISPKMIFPEDGSIEFGRWAEIARKEAPGRDVDAVASAFRGFCRMHDIPFDKPGIEKSFATFAGKFGKTRAA